MGTTDTEVSDVGALRVTTAEVGYLLRHLNHYLARPVTPVQIVSGTAGVRPLVAAGDHRQTKKLARDHVLEQDARTGLISIMGGKWTTHRAMAEDTVNMTQTYLLGATTPCRTREHALIGSEGYAPDSWRSLQSSYNLPEATARHLAGKFGARAAKVLTLVEQDRDLANSVLPDLAPLKAEVVHCIRNEMAVTIEDVLCRRLGIQLYSWRFAIRAGPVVGAILARELGWSSDFSQNSVQQYAHTINRYLESAGLKPEL